MAEGTKKKSDVWKYFVKIEESVVECKLCACKLSYRSSTSAMINHLSAKHPSLKHPSAVAENKSRQPTITGFVQPKRRCDVTREGKITALITQMITQEMLPFSFVEAKAFRDLMEFVEPEYTVPSRRTATSRVETMYADAVEKLKNSLQMAGKVAITTDSWTALTTESYVTITCHFIDNDWKVQTAVLQTRSTDDRHTAENLAENLKAATADWNVSEKVCACVHDNARNMVVANQRLTDWESVPCFAHTLQLAINDGFKTASVSRVIGACGRLVAHFHHSTVATATLKKKQADQNIPQHKLIQHCRTRWNSIHDMFERLHEQRWAVCATLSDRNTTKLSEARALELADDNWQTIEDILPTLHSLKCATTVMCSETHVCLSMVHPVTRSLLSKHLLPTERESTKVSEFKKTVADSLRKRIALNATTCKSKVHNL